MLQGAPVDLLEGRALEEVEGGQAEEAPAMEAAKKAAASMKTKARKGRLPLGLRAEAKMAAAMASEIARPEMQSQRSRGMGEL
jgi:hypothetical protein